MSAQLETWITESSPAKQTAVGVGIFVVGLVLAIGFRDFDAATITGSTAGFLLGILCLVISAATLLTGGQQTISVEPQFKRIVIVNRTRVRTTSKTIFFNEIAQVYVGEHGDKEGGSINYYVAAKLKTGKEVALFFGFFEGGYDRSVMEARCQRLIQNMQSYSLGG
jgi:hypothetical protein